MGVVHHSRHQALAPPEPRVHGDTADPCVQSGKYCARANMSENP